MESMTPTSTPIMSIQDTQSRHCSSVDRNLKPYFKAFFAVFVFHRETKSEGSASFWLRNSQKSFTLSFAFFFCRKMLATSSFKIFIFLNEIAVFTLCRNAKRQNAKRHVFTCKYKHTLYLLCYVLVIKKPPAQALTRVCRWKTFNVSR